MIALRNVTLRRGARVLLDGVNVTINPGEKAALVGRNGAGKSSVFALLNGSLHEDAGEVSIPPHWRYSQVAQHMPETDEPATAFVLDGDTRLAELRAALQEAETSGDGMRIAQLHADLADAGAHDASPRAQALILGLGFRVHELEQPVSSFSGGWRMRLQLARALMCPSDLLLLDEPTNHLDLDALVWLESWLQRYPGTLLVISHDREFLDAVTGVTLHIEHQKVTRYGGNYSAFETLRAQQLANQQSAYARQQDKIAHLQKFIDRFKAKATKAKQAQSRVKALERMEQIAPVLADAEFSFEFREPQSLPNPMLTIRDAVLGYGAQAHAAPGGEGDGAPAAPDGAQPQARVILRSVSRSVLAGQRIGVLGANGQGKSTLVKTIAGEIPALGGSITQGKGLQVGYFAQQELDVLRADEDPLQHMARLAREVTPNAREQELRNFLGSFNFSGDMVTQAVGSMSGGEKARLVLAMIVWQRPNLLLLDEPTNHLDLATREALSVALNEFEGTVLLVSHDRALLRAVCDEFWLVARGEVGPFDGDLDDYQRYLLDEAKRVREAAKLDAAAAPAPATGGATPQEQRRIDAAARQQLSARTRPLKKELDKLEQRMARLQEEKQDLEQRLGTALPVAEIADAGRRLKQASGELEQAEERWLELSAEIESIESGAN